MWKIKIFYDSDLSYDNGKNLGQRINNFILDNEISEFDIQFSTNKHSEYGSSAAIILKYKEREILNL